MPTPEQVKELKDKITQLIDRKYGGDWDQAFQSYSKGDSKIDRDELVTVLTEASIGNWITRGAWADGIIKELDTSQDGKLDQSEFRTAIQTDGAALVSDES